MTSEQDGGRETGRRFFNKQRSYLAQIRQEIFCDFFTSTKRAVSKEKTPDEFIGRFYIRR